MPIIWQFFMLGEDFIQVFTKLNNNTTCTAPHLVFHCSELGSLVLNQDKYEHMHVLSDDTDDAGGDVDCNDDDDDDLDGPMAMTAILIYHQFNCIHQL